MNAVDDAITDIEQQFAQLFQRVRGRWKELAQTIHPELQPLGAKVLFALLDGGPMQPKQLAERLTTDKSVLSRQVAHLEEFGLVERSIDQSDARARVLALTPTAVAQLTGIREARREQLRAALARWPVDELRGLAELLRRLGDVL